MLSHVDCTALSGIPAVATSLMLDETSFSSPVEYAEAGSSVCTSAIKVASGATSGPVTDSASCVASGCMLSVGADELDVGEE